MERPQTEQLTGLKSHSKVLSNEIRVSRGLNVSVASPPGADRRVFYQGIGIIGPLRPAWLAPGGRRTARS